MASRVKTATCQSKRRRTNREWKTEVAISREGGAAPVPTTTKKSVVFLNLFLFQYTYGIVQRPWAEDVDRLGTGAWQETRRQQPGRQAGSSLPLAAQQQASASCLPVGLTGRRVADKAKCGAFLSAVLLERRGKGRLCNNCYLIAANRRDRKIERKRTLSIRHFFFNRWAHDGMSSPAV